MSPENSGHLQVFVFVCAHFTVLPAQDVSDLRLVPFPKEVNMTPGQRFSLKTPLQLRFSEKNMDVLVVPLLDELKRAGFPAPQLVPDDFDEPRLILGKTPGTFLFAGEKTGAVPPKGSSNNLLVRSFSVFWAIKTNEQGLALGLTTPGAPAYYVIGPGGALWGVAIDTIEPRSHFVTFAGMLDGRSAQDVMETIRLTFDLSNQPIVTLHEKEER